jgi:hypothetical protein
MKSGWLTILIRKEVNDVQLISPVQTDSGPEMLALNHVTLYLFAQTCVLLHR